MWSSGSINISVIMPVYNRQETVEQAIQSVLDQTYPHFEFIIVDDGSTDSTKEVIRQVKDPRIRLIENATSIGAAAARNIGVEHAVYDWLAFQDSDDVWLPQKLEKQLKVL